MQNSKSNALDKWTDHVHLDRALYLKYFDPILTQNKCYNGTRPLSHVNKEELTGPNQVPISITVLETINSNV